MLQQNSESEAFRLAQQQLDAYNARDIDAFAACYAEDVELMRFESGQVFCRGRAELYERYGAMFASHPLLHCQLVQRMVQGNIAIDQEDVVGLEEGRRKQAIAIYEVRNSLIQRAWFV